MATIIAPQIPEKRPKGFFKNLITSMSQSLPHGMQSLLQNAREAQKQKNIMDLLGNIYGKNQSDNEQNFAEEVSKNPHQEIRSQMQNVPDESIASITMQNPSLGKTIQEQKKLAYKKFSDERKLSFDETKEYRKRISEQARGAEELEPVLNQMEKLVRTGKLTNPMIAKIAEKYGLIGLLDPKSQQFQSLSVGFLKDAKNLFGARVTNYDLQIFMDKIPRLAQTDAGKKVLIDNFKVIGEASKIRNKIKNQIIKENKGIPPLDLEEKVSERATPQIEALADKFNKNLYSSEESSPGKIYMRSPDGRLGEVPKERIDEALTKGYFVE